MEMLVLDQTRPDIGLPVVKVIVPGMRQFWARFAPGRLFDVPVALGRQLDADRLRRAEPAFPCSCDQSNVARSLMVSKESGARARALTHLWSLREDVLVEERAERDRIVVVTKWGEIGIDGADDVVLASLRRMSWGRCRWRTWCPAGGPRTRAQVAAPGRDVAAARTTGRSGRNCGRCWICSAVPWCARWVSVDGDSPLLSAVPIARTATLRLPEIDQASAVRLSRFAAIRPYNGELLVESPLAQYHVVLHRDLAVHVVAALGLRNDGRAVERVARYANRGGRHSGVPGRHGDRTGG